jgi:poly-gamma-glutamate synthesis protein (capsule biosynthesis protein)
VTLVAVGDVLVNRPEAETALSGVRPLLDAADVAFGNFEGVLTDSRTAAPGASASSLTATSNARGVAGLDIVSVANNHTMDAGRAGLEDTLTVLAKHDVATAGAGMTLEEALRPAVVERGGLRLAVVAVTAVLRHGAEARPGVAGVAPLRADDCYLPAYPGTCTPGVPPRVLSVFNESDWDKVVEALERARAEADVVVASAHWGDHTRPWVLTDHERLCAGLLAESGADVVLGHHHHMLRGTEVLAGKPVYFGLGHIVFDFPGFTDELASYGFRVSGASPEQLSATFGEYGIYPRPEQPEFPFHPLARRTGVAVIELSAGGVDRFGIVPCLIEGTGVARPVTRTDAEWPELVNVVNRCQREPGLPDLIRDDGWTFAGYDVIEYRSSAC